ncbi:hypothetical protein SCLCIDRAFT_21205 [Scleroderma citrinum Foug A]|uniref:Uncharacterized protein n=1 Tax=Scleroderma citrinum Foug A TaxID=1036808 RepID=A0A0C3E3F9_9AGAM|nr:hypothetical protein SCLCIDRAFT_21205 [Scleroderma citrinum Foug A]
MHRQEEAERQRMIDEAWEQMEREQQEMQTRVRAITVTQGGGTPGPSTAVAVPIVRACKRCTLLLKEPEGCVVREKGKAQACLFCQKVCKVCIWPLGPGGTGAAMGSGTEASGKSAPRGGEKHKKVHTTTEEGEDDEDTEEAAATDITDLLGVLAGWEPDDGSYDWECQDAILKWTFYTSVPISILRPIQKLNTVHEIFNYLAKRFCNNNPIVDPCTKKSKPSTNKVEQAGAATEDISADSEKQKESPMSENAAMERHVNTKRDEEDLPRTKDLSTRGTEDPRANLETSAEGNSAESTDGTLVLLTGTPHETQNELQNSLVAMAGCTNGTVERAEPTVADTDVNRMALLGREPAERASGVDEGDGMEREPQMRLPKTELFCEETRQHNGNAEDNIPIANRLPLEGEWTVYPSGKMKNSNGGDAG